MHNTSADWLADSHEVGQEYIWPKNEWILLKDPLSFLEPEYSPWVCSVVAAFAIGLAGIAPLLFLPAGLEDGRATKSGCTLHLLLSFAVGGLLGDVFLHLLPEAWTVALEAGACTHEAFNQVGLCVLAGIFVFLVVEMIAVHNSKSKSSSVTGYLNLVANGIDNFSHGLAVGGSFMVSLRTGILVTLAILIHEIPHEVGDFAILLNSGFTRWGAACAQLFTASIGLLGAVVTLTIGSTNIIGDFHVYILGFTAGGFLNIALVTLIPDLLDEIRPSHSAAQLLFIILGALSMAVMSMIC